ncbi:MAG TPA: hypothetical protein VGM27_16595 [Acidobacteriaceae bacterium]
MKTLVRLRSFFLPACIGLLLVVAAGLYNLVWLPSEHRYLDDRNFRLLTTLSEQISASIDNFDRMMDNASDSGVSDATLESYLNKVAPQLKKLDDEDRKVLGNAYGDPPNIAIQADEGTHFLYLAYKRDRNKTKYAVRTDLDKLIRKVLPPDNRNPFDVVLVAQGNGTVIFQKSLPGLAVARIDALEDTSAGTKDGKTESATKPPSQSSNFAFSRFSEITLEGTHYRLYSQPLQISLRQIDAVKKSAHDSVAQPEPWVLCGLVRAEAFRSESQSISYTYLLWLSFAILLVVAAYPFLKLIVSSPAERFRASDVVITAIFACAATATLTFALLDVYYLRKDFDQRGQEDPMLTLAKAIDTKFSQERDGAFRQLQDFYEGSTLPEDLHKAQGSSQRHPTFTGDKGECKPKWACRTQILDKIAPEHLSDYPYLQFASWGDSNGDQRIKWSTMSHVTPFINLDDPSNTYYPAIKKAFAFGSSGGPAPVPAKGIGSQYSPNTGDYITIFWQLLDLHGKPASDLKNAFCASVVTRPISVVDPILPAGFQFAIIQPDGTVVFHSDSTRNLRENFFAETDQNQEVRSRVLMRASGPLLANYMGRGHRLYIYPALQSNELWTVIVFRDLRVEETMNLEVLSLASILFAVYAVVMLLGLLLVHLSGRGHVTGSWLWPDSRKAGAYKWLVIVNLAAILLLLVLPKLPEIVVLLFFVVCVPVVVLVINVMTLQKQAEHSKSEGALEEPKSSRWQLGYFSTISTLLAVIAILPCLSFFKVAWDFEHRLLIKRSQLRLADDLDDRAERVRTQYVGVDLGPKVGQELLDPDEPAKRYFSYYNSFLRTAIHSERELAPRPNVPCGVGSACKQEHLLESFLSTISPLYNEIAYDGRYLTQPSFNSRTWSSTSSKVKEELKLTIQEPGKKIRSITSLWTPLHIPWGDWIWWMGSLAYMAALFCLVRFSLRKIFLLDLSAPDGEQGQRDVQETSNLLTMLHHNMVVIGRDSSPTIESLVHRKDVQAYDLYEMLKTPMAKVATRVGSSVAVRAVADPVQKIVLDGRPVEFYNFERGLDDPASNQQMLSTLERVLSMLHKPVVIASKVDPPAKASGDEREQWQKVLQSFVRIDLNSGPTQRADETWKEFEERVFREGYYNWLFSGRSETQKLVLVQMAEERLVNPNSWPDVRELMEQGLVVRACGMLRIRDSRFVQYLKRSISRDLVKEWESHGVGRSNTLRAFLLVTGAAVVIFVLCTQTAVVNSWITYATGLAAAIPALLKVLDLLRGVSATASSLPANTSRGD